MEVRSRADCNRNNPSIMRANLIHTSSQLQKAWLVREARLATQLLQLSVEWVKRFKTVSMARYHICVQDSAQSSILVPEWGQLLEVSKQCFIPFLETDAMMKRATSVQQKGPPGKEDRSLSPLKFHNNGQRIFASMTNKDWALSETYQYVKAKLAA